MPKIQWSEMMAIDKSIIAASPMVQGSCECPHRIVIRDLGDKYVVHTQLFDGVQRPHFHAGDYFVKTRRFGAHRSPAGCRGALQGVGSFRGAGAPVTSDGFGTGEEVDRGRGHR